MATSEKLVILVKGKPVDKGTLVDVGWHIPDPMTGGRRRRHAVSLVHEVGSLNNVSGMVVTGRDGKLTAVLTPDVVELKVIKRKY